MLTDLTHLWLYANKLDGKIPKELLSVSGLTNLVSLRLNRNLCTCLRDHAPGLGVSAASESPRSLRGPLSPTPPHTSLRRRRRRRRRRRHLTPQYAAAAAVVGPIHAGLGSLAELREVHLDRNMLSGPLNHTLTKLTKLESLRVNDNQLDGTVPAYLRARNHGLRDLQLHGNQFDTKHDAEEGAVVRTVNSKKVVRTGDDGSTVTSGAKHMYSFATAAS